MPARNRRHARGDGRLPESSWRGAGRGAGMTRKARVERVTKETSVTVDLVVDGSGNASAETGLPFFDHMLDQLGKHGGWDLEIRRSEEHTSELQSRLHLVCRLLLEKKKK